MKKIVSLGLSAKDIEEIIAQYFGVNPEQVTLGVDGGRTVFGYVEKELTFPEEKQTITAPYSPWYVRPIDTSKGPYDYPNPLNPNVTWTSSDALGSDGATNVTRG